MIWMFGVSNVGGKAVRGGYPLKDSCQRHKPGSCSVNQFNFESSLLRASFQKYGSTKSLGESAGTYANVYFTVKLL
jgi:hypothetical protein